MAVRRCHMEDIEAAGRQHIDEEPSAVIAHDCRDAETNGLIVGAMASRNEKAGAAIGNERAETRSLLRTRHVEGYNITFRQPGLAVATAITMKNKRLKMQTPCCRGGSMRSSRSAQFRCIM
ncbi:hypothetical protein KP509_39G022400 [Ceratopteris richardii]|nr:hypothetical protein KP509_39G022400 [Ceratopteris richardii]